MSRSRAAVLLLACPAVLTGCRFWATTQQSTKLQTLAPPVIAERFTPLPCPRGRAARTTVGAEGCLGKEILRTDAEIDARARTMFRSLPDAIAKRKLVAAERSWLVYRDARCRSVSDVYRGGTAEPVLYADCVVARNRDHLRELAGQPFAVPRAPTFKEREAIVAALPKDVRDTPVECFWLIIRVSSRDPAYASVGGAFMNWEKPGARCLRYTNNGGLMIMKKRRGRWKIVWAGTTDPSCSLRIPRDLIGCHRG
jgi:uncharacterized protein YecT (DUF1311 family)